MIISIYDSTSGEILRVGDCPGSMVSLQMGAGEVYVEGAADDVADYVSAGAIVPRPPLPVTQSGHTLTVPPGTEYSVVGPAYAEGSTEDGVLEFEFSEPGTYTVRLKLFPYLDTEVILEG